jgi:hypothetical protein
MHVNGPLARNWPDGMRWLAQRQARRRRDDFGCETGTRDQKERGRGAGRTFTRDRRRSHAIEDRPGRVCERMVRRAGFARRTAMGGVRIAIQVTARHMMHGAEHARAASRGCVGSQSADHSWQISKGQGDHADNRDPSALHVRFMRTGLTHSQHIPLREGDSIGKYALFCS